MRSFNIPEFYKSPVISTIKNARRISDPRKKDLTPTVLDFGPVRFYIARHFGFCFGVENAIEISFKALEENKGKRIFLLSQMIHNPEVNKDLQERGITFIMDTEGNQLLPWTALSKDDVVIIPAFGTTLSVEAQLAAIGLNVHKYNTTCPFVERVWNKAEKLGSEQHTIIIHGKPKHEETRATFSHSAVHGHSIIVKDMKEAQLLGAVINGAASIDSFHSAFSGRYSEGFDPTLHLKKVGVINQTTMLANETQGIADYFKQVMVEKYGASAIKDHFADTHDTLCYATNENQDATYELLKQPADLAIVVGGYNSSNTSHLVELCESKFPTYFISSADEIKSVETIHHFNYHQQEHLITNNFIPTKNPVNIILTSGASCPDSLLDKVLQKLISYFNGCRTLKDVIHPYVELKH